MQDDATKAAAQNEPQQEINEANGADTPQLDAEMLKKIAALRTHVHESFGKIALAMVALPRYRHLAIGDLAHLVMEPLIRDRIAIASSAKEDESPSDLAGIAIWASVTEEVDAKIREQIKAGVFPVRLHTDDWTGGPINWLLDVIAPNERLATAVIANFKQVIKEGSLKIHPIVSQTAGQGLQKITGTRESVVSK